LIFQNGGFGEASNHTFCIGWADNDVPTAHPSTGNVCIVQSGCAVTNLSIALVQSNNALFVYGGAFGGGYTNIFGGSTTNNGQVVFWGKWHGALHNTAGSTFILSNNAGAASFSRDLICHTGSVSQIALGTSYNPASVGSNLTLNGTLNFIDSGGFGTVGNHTYLLFTHNTTTNLIVSPTQTNNVPYYANTNNLSIGKVAGYPYANYTISMPDVHTVNLIVGGLLQITSIARSGNNILINWNTQGANGQFNYVQASSGSGNGSYPGTFADIGSITIAGPTATFTDVGGAIAGPYRYYRIRSPQ
jgi:hypothetical protein